MLLMINQKNKEMKFNRIFSLLPFFLLGSTLSRSTKSNPTAQVGKGSMLGNAEYGKYHATRNNRKRKHNMLHISKYTRLKHRKYATQ